jgi:hypothetical protein
MIILGFGSIAGLIASIVLYTQGKKKKISFGFFNISF